MIDLIVAMDPNGVIGKNNKLPWKLKDDLKFFREMTMGAVLLMGRKTWESIGCKSLPGRYSLILSHKPLLKDDDNSIIASASNVEIAINILTAVGQRKSFVIGGSSVYEQVLEKKMINTAIISHVKKEYEGDAYFPTKYLDGAPRTLIRTFSEFDVYEYDLRWQDE